MFKCCSAVVRYSASVSQYNSLEYIDKKRVENLTHGTNLVLLCTGMKGVKYGQLTLK